MESGSFVNISGTIRDFASPVVDLAVSANLPVGILQWFGPGFPAASGTAAIDMKARGLLASPEASGALDVKGARVGQFGIGDVSGSFKLDGGRLGVSGLKLRNEAARLQIDGTVTLSGDFPVEADVKLERVDLHKLLDVLNAHNDAWVEMTAAGPVHAKGRFAGGALFTLGLDLAVTDLKVHSHSWKKSIGKPPSIMGLKSARVVGTAELTPERIGLKRGKVLVEDASLTVDGSYWNFSTEGGQHIRAKSDSLPLHPVSPLAGFKISGRGPVECLISGPYNNPRITGRLRAAGMQVDQFQAGELELRVDLKDSVLSFLDVKGRRGGMKYSGELVLDLRKDLRISAGAETSGAPLQDVLAFLNFKGINPARSQGLVSFTGGLDGPASGLSGRATLDVYTAKFYDHRIDRLRADASASDGTLRIERLTAALGPARLYASGWISQNKGAMEFSVKAERMRLKDLPVAAFKKLQLDSEYKLRAQVGGRVADPGLDVSVTFKDTVIGDHAVQNSYLDGSIRGGRLDLRADLLGGAIRAHASGDLLAQHQVLQLRADAKAFGWEQLLPSPGSLKGRIDAVLEASIPMKEHGRGSATLSLETFEMELPPLKLALADSAALSFKDGNFSMQPARFSGNGVDLTLRSLGAGGLTAGGTLSLKLLELLAGDLLTAEGSASFSMVMTAKGLDPDFSGNASLRDGRISFKDFPHPIEGLAFRAHLDGGKARFSDVRAVLAGGALEGTGEMELYGGVSPWHYRFTGHLRGANLKYPKVFPSRVSGTLTVDGDNTSMTLGGDLNIEWLRFSEELQWDKLLAELRRKRTTFASFEKEKEFLKFDLGLHGENDIKVKNNLADADLKVDLRLTGTAQRLGMLGSVNLIKGNLNLFSNVFEIRRTNIHFKDKYRLSYLVDGEASSVCHDQNANVDHPIRMEVTGESGDIRINYRDLYSPPLSESDIIMCMTVGTTAEQIAKGGKDSYYGLLSSVSGLDSRVRSLVPIPIETFRVSQAYSAYSRMTVPVLQVTWKVTDNGRISYQASMVNSTDQKIDLTYRLNRVTSAQFNWSNQSTLVSMGNLGLDLKLKWEY
jgi:hypothetical protein